jgi:hypothetical protein
VAQQRRVAIAVKLAEQIFLQNPTVDTARRLFLVCQKYGMQCPAEAFDIVVRKLQEEEAKYQKVVAKNYLSSSEKMNDDEKLLSLALSSESLKTAYKKFRGYLDQQNRKESVNDNALRKRVERYLNSQLYDILEQNGDYVGQHDLSELLSLKLCDKLDIYKEIIADW